MTQNLPRSKFLTACLLVCCLAPATAVTLDGIVAVVEKDVVLLSELNEITRLSLAREGTELPDSSIFYEMRRLVLSRIIDDKVLLARAKTESLQVTNEEVNAYVDQQVAAQVKRSGSQEQLEEDLKSYGLTLAKLKKQLKDEIRDQFLKMRFRDKLLLGATVTREEVTQFYNEYKDSLPREEASVNLSHIMLIATPAAELENEARQKLSKIKARLDAGERFEQLAYENSDDPTAKDSGDIGFIKKGELGLPEFENAAFQLKPGELSPIVRTVIGFHLIKVTEQRDQKVRAKHILALVKAGDASKQRITSLLDSIRTVAADSASFAECAKKFSEDTKTNTKGGYLGWYTSSRLSPVYQNAIANIKPGEISGPVEIGEAFHVFRMNNLVENRALTLEDDYQVIQNIAKSEKVKKELEQKLKSWRDEFYIETFLSEFEH